MRSGNFLIKYALNDFKPKGSFSFGPGFHVECEIHVPILEIGVEIRSKRILIRNQFIRESQLSLRKFEFNKIDVFHNRHENDLFIPEFRESKSNDQLIYQTLAEHGHPVEVVE